MIEPCESLNIAPLSTGPPGLLVSTDGARSFAVDERAGLSNTNVASLGLDRQGRVCAATNGDGYQRPYCILAGLSCM